MCLCKLATLQLGATFQLLLTTCHQDEMSLLHLILFFRGMLHISKFCDACSKAEEVCWKLICVLETIEIFDSVFYLIVRTNNLYQIDTLKSKFSQESRDKLQFIHCFDLISMLRFCMCLWFIAKYNRVVKSNHKLWITYTVVFSKSTLPEPKLGRFGLSGSGKFIHPSPHSTIFNNLARAR